MAVTGGWRADPRLALLAAAAAPTICFLDGGSRGASLLALPTAAVPLRSLADLPASPAGRCGLAGGGWPPDLAGGGGVLQLDYEFPVGAHAHAFPGGGVRGWYWPCPAWVAWPPGGPAVVGGDDPPAMAALTARLDAGSPAAVPLPAASAIHPAWDRTGHCWRVARIRELIAAGDIYQANLTVPFAADLGSGPGAMDLGCFLAMRARSDAGFAAFLRHAGRAIVSHSPECFLAADGGRLASRPIKGTRRRVPGQEAAVRAELFASAKDRAELAMIVDLVRNDLGRVAAPGSVRVVAPAAALDLEYVHHLEATVMADLPPAIDLGACLAAAFPAGSITGAPKIRAMRILAGLEAGPRGPYCGTFGWVASPRHFALAVAIRTMTVTAGRVRFDAGGGIVSDSEGEVEWDEVTAKASVMAAALGGRG